MIRPYRGSAIAGSLQPIMPYQNKINKITSLSFTRVRGWTLNGIWSFLRPVYKQVGSPSRRLKIARLHKRNVSDRVTLLPGNELRPVSFTSTKRGSIFPETFMARACFPNVSQFPIRATFLGNFCWLRAAGLSEPLPHYSLFCGQIINPILVTFWQMQFSWSQLSHFLFMALPYRAF